MHYVIPTGELGQEFRDGGNLIQHRVLTDLPGGVFAIHAMAPSESPISSKVWNFQPVERLLGTDPLGHLYIGWTDDFLAIAAEMAGTAKPQKRGAGPFFSAYHSNDAVQERFPWDQIAISFLFREYPADVGARRLVEYKLRFGEFPPLHE